MKNSYSANECFSSSSEHKNNFYGNPSKWCVGSFQRSQMILISCPHPDMAPLLQFVFMSSEDTLPGSLHDRNYKLWLGWSLQSAPNAEMINKSQILQLSLP